LKQAPKDRTFIHAAGLFLGAGGPILKCFGCGGGVGRKGGKKGRRKKEEKGGRGGEEEATGES